LYTNDKSHVPHREITNIIANIVHPIGNERMIEFFLLFHAVTSLSIHLDIPHVFMCILV
jgi:hypothetical protein